MCELTKQVRYLRSLYRKKEITFKQLLLEYNKLSGNFMVDHEGKVLDLAQFKGQQTHPKQKELDFSKKEVYNPKS
jgi:hypothetical protein